MNKALIILMTSAAIGAIACAAPASALAATAAAASAATAPSANGTGVGVAGDRRAEAEQASLHPMQANMTPDGSVYDQSARSGRGYFDRFQAYVAAPFGN
jgi:uncharacterized lipoprotein YajG